MIISVDPGGSTGMAFRLDDGNFACITIPSYDMRKIVDTIVSRSGILKTVVIESFLGIQYRNEHGIETLELIGAVRGICAFLGIPCVKQAPLERIPKVYTARTMLEKRRTELGMDYTAHEVAALAHLLVFERNVAAAKAIPLLTRTPATRRGRRVIKL